MSASREEVLRVSRIPRRMQVVRDGRDPLTGPCLEYLESLGVPAADVKRIELDSTIGDVQLLTVTLIVRHPVA